MREIRKAIDDYYADKRKYPGALSDLVPDYIRHIPSDPITRRADTWIITTEADGKNVVDVHSGARGTTCAGARYSDL